MSNIINLHQERKKKDTKDTDPLERAKVILSPKKNHQTKKEIILKVKGVLRSRNIKYRVTYKDAPKIIQEKKGDTILFPEHKIVFLFLNKSTGKIFDNEEICSSWTIINIVLDHNIKPVDYVMIILNRLMEKTENGEADQQKTN